MFRTFSLSLAVVGLSLSPAMSAPPSNTETLRDATAVLDDLSAIPLRGIPPSLLADAQGVAIIPRVIKAGFIVGGRGGHGVVLTRGADGVWANPTFVDIGGASVGFQAGVQSTDVVLVFRSRKSLDRIMEGKGKLTLGADAAIAAGPIGRQAAAGTDGRLEAEIFSYSRSRGLFAGVALDGAYLASDAGANAQYARDTRPETAKSAAMLQKRLTELSATRVVVDEPPVVMVPAPAPVRTPEPIPGPAPVVVPTMPPQIMPPKR